MKRTLTLIACVAICSAIFVSCKSTKTIAPTPEEIQAQKQALADSVLAYVDTLANQLIESSSKSFKITKLQMTDAKKMVKPDYLLDPALANNFVTKSQKINALAIYATEKFVRILYDMPTDEIDKVIAKLTTEVNLPLELDYANSNASISEPVKKVYNTCAERGELHYFWQYEEAYGAEMNYLMVMEPDLFFDNITEEQWQGYYNRRYACVKATAYLAEYDDDMNALHQFLRSNWTTSELVVAHSHNSTKESAKAYRIANKDKYIALRNALLK